MKYGGNYYVTTTGTKINPKEDPRAKQIIDATQKDVDKMLTYSDDVQTGDLLRFYTPEGFKKVNRKDYSYQKASGLKQLKKANKDNPTSVKAKHNNQSTLKDYITDAPELGGKPQTIQEATSSSQDDKNNSSDSSSSSSSNDNQ